MAVIVRSIKSATSTTAWADGVGNKVLAAEHNADLDTIYAEFNGNIENANIKAAAAIAYSKLNLSAAIVNADIDPAADIAGSKLLDGSVDGGTKLTAASLLADRIASEEQMLATPATANVSAKVDMNTDATWTDVGPSVGITPTGAVVVLAMIQGFASQRGDVSNTEESQLYMRLRREGSTNTNYREMQVGHVEDAEGENFGAPFSLVVPMTLEAGVLNTILLQYYKVNAGFGATWDLNPTFSGAPAFTGTLPGTAMTVLPIYAT